MSGVNNDYLVKTLDPLALLYNDRSPMENHHTAAAFQLLLCDEQYAAFSSANSKVSVCEEKMRGERERERKMLSQIHAPSPSHLLLIVSGARNAAQDRDGHSAGYGHEAAFQLCLPLQHEVACTAEPGHSSQLEIFRCQAQVVVQRHTQLHTGTHAKCFFETRRIQEGRFIASPAKGNTQKLDSLCPS